MSDEEPATCGADDRVFVGVWAVVIFLVASIVGIVYYFLKP